MKELQIKEFLREEKNEIKKGILNSDNLIELAMFEGRMEEIKKMEEFIEELFNQREEEV